MEDQDDLKRLQEISDPNLTILTALYHEYDVDSKGSGRYHTGLSNACDNSQYVPAVRSYNAAAPSMGSEASPRRQPVIASPLRPMLDTHLPAFPPSSNNEYNYIYDPAMTISPMALELDSKIIITAPEGCRAMFDADLGDLSPLRTPSLYSGTSCNTPQNFANNFQSAQDQRWSVSPSRTSVEPSSTLDPTQYRGYAGSKRTSIDLQHDEDGRPKRARSVTGGYSCHGCDKSFDRACDERKHFNNVHGTKRHGCELCDSRFTYPKDVKRHMKQMHHISTTGFQQEKVKAPRQHRSLSSVVSMLSRLKLWSKDSVEEEKREDFILVTQDHRNFRKVYLKGLENSEALMREIGNVFGTSLGHVDDAMLRRCAGKGRLGKHVGGPQLMAAVRKAVAAKETLELFFTPKDDTKTDA